MIMVIMMVMIDIPYMTYVESPTKKLRDLLKVEKLKRPSTDSLEHSQNLGVSVSKITQKTQIYNNCIGIIQKTLVHHLIQKNFPPHLKATVANSLSTEGSTFGSYLVFVLPGILEYFVSFFAWNSSLGR